MRARNILYAEDNPDDVLIFKMACKRAGWAQPLHAVEDGETAIAWLNGDAPYADREKYPLPDVLLLDLKMPRKTGFDVLEWARKSANFAALPVIILSSSDDPRDMKRSLELGATGYVVKTASCEEIIARLRALP
ncbi:MAG TPA: response regulator [Verrucomicrobiae bacterium]|jgi:DNA-binding response OmpR family regulator|nr:response regulator [Verrucomicrobiae bacterium]